MHITVNIDPLSQAAYRSYAAVEVNTKIQVFKQVRPSRVTKQGITGNKPLGARGKWRSSFHK
jgi:hypothetical protein